MFDNKEFYKEYDIFNSNLVILKSDNIRMFNIYKGNKYELILTTSLSAGFTLSAFVFTKKLAKIHENNKLARKKKFKKLQMQRKSKARKGVKNVIKKQPKKRG